MHVLRCRQHIWKMEALQLFFNTLAALSISPVAPRCSPSHRKYAVLSPSSHMISQRPLGHSEWWWVFFFALQSFSPPSARSIHPLQTIIKKKKKIQLHSRWHVFNQAVHTSVCKSCWGVALGAQQGGDLSFVKEEVKNK